MWKPKHIAKKKVSYLCVNGMVPLQIALSMFYMMLRRIEKVPVGIR